MRAIFWWSPVSCEEIGLQGRVTRLIFRDPGVETLRDLSHSREDSSAVGPVILTAWP